MQSIAQVRLFVACLFVPVNSLKLRQLAQVVAEPAPGATVQACTGQYLRALAPGDGRSAALQLADELHVFIARQGLEAAGTPVSLGADAQVGPVDMPVTVPVLVVLVVANLRRFIEA